MEVLQSTEVARLAEGYRDWTAENLSKIIRTPAMSTTEGDRIRLLESMCVEAGCDEVRIDGLGNLLARVGSGPRKLAIDAHIDTVGVGDVAQWVRDPFSGEIADGLVHGRGAADQLGGAASMITAARILAAVGHTAPYEVWFTFTTLEEDCDGLCWLYLIEEEGFVPDLYVSTEATSLQLYRGHRGRMELEVRLKGISCHGSAPERGVSAAYRAARTALAIEALNESLQPDPGAFLGKGTVTVSKLEVHGPSQCAVPDQGLVYLDRRLTSGETKELAVAQVTEAARAAGVLDAEVVVPRYEVTSWTGARYGQELYFPTWTIPADHPLVQAGILAHRHAFGSTPIVDKWTFSTNAVAVAGRHGIPSIGFGPGDAVDAHAPNESIRVDDLWKAAALYAALPQAAAELVP